MVNYACTEWRATNSSTLCNVGVLWLWETGQKKSAIKESAYNSKSQTEEQQTGSEEIKETLQGKQSR